MKESLPENLRQELKAAGVDVLSYVPENTFLVRCHGTRLEEVRSLPFVAWLDEYRPEHKIHRSLQPAQNARAAAPVQEVTVLLAPRAQGAEIAETRRAFNAIRQESTLRSGTVLRGALTPGRLEALARSSAVLWIEPDRNMRLFDEVASKIVAGDGGFQQLYTDTLGFDGAGVRVAVADSGLDNGEAESMHPDLSGRTPGFFHYGTLTDAADEHSHGTHVAGIIAGNGTVGETDENGTLYGLGVAPGAEIIGQRIFDGVGNYEPPPSFEKMTRDATRAGADIGSNSWGDDTQGRYDVSAMEFDELVRDADALMLGNQQYILEFSAGNAGPAPQTIGSPAVAKNVIATGASQNDRADFMVYDLGPDGMADFSSRGPCEDGRIKPDIVAPGTWIASLQSSSATDEFAWAAISPYYQYQGGTSQAGPHASGAAAVFVQYYRSLHSQTPSPALVKAALINCAVDMDDAVETGPIPNMDEGWGRIDVAALVDGSLNYDFIDQTVLMTNGQVFERRVLAGFAEPLKVTLAYTDVPGFPGAVTALVNDLDLEVTGPDGRVYRGNQFLEGESVPDANANDAINNVEQVLLYAPTPGEYVIRVRARNVFQDARDDTPFVDQDFALVISGETPAPGVGTLFLNRPAYKAGTPILLTLVDTDLAGQGSATVTVRSTTETAGEPVLLVPADQPGSFTGMIATVTGPAVPDNRLQIAHNDLITIQYFDVSSGVERTATARGDLMAPVLSNIADSMQFGQTLITWQTDE
ncbi:MAG TPA: S8 family serine peptidase, partial [Clostridia bacterium]|nr:S8 family serine peptidase [Clostridia bacterium]